MKQSVRKPKLGRVALLLLAQSTQALTFGAISLFLPLIRQDLGITFAQAGVLAGVATLSYAVMQVPSGILADWFGAKRIFIVGLLVVNLLSASFSFLHDFHALLVNQALSGIFRALVFAPGLMLMSAMFSEDRRSTASGLYIAGGFSSSVLLNLLGPLLVVPLGWRHLILSFAVGGVAIVSVLALAPERTVIRPPKPLFRELPRLFRTSTIWWAGAVQFTRLAIVNALFFWLPSLLVADKGLSIRHAGFIVALSAAITAPSNIAGGYLADRLQRPATLIVVSLCAMALTIGGLIFARDPIAIVLLVACNSLFVQLYFGPLFSLPIKAYGPRYAGVLSGFGNLCANLGGFTFDIVLGQVKELTGSFQLGLAMLLVLCLAGALAAVRLGRAVERIDHAARID